MTAFKTFETKLNDVFGKNAPKLPEGGKAWLIKYLPVIALVLGILSLLATWQIWRWAHVVNTYGNFASQVCNTAGVECNNILPSRLTAWIWITLLVMITESLLYLFSYPGLQARKKQGWNYLYYGALLNVAYAIVSLFSNYGSGFFSFIWSLLTSAVGLWLLFQVRDAYTGKRMPGARNRKK